MLKLKPEQSLSLFTAIDYCRSRALSFHSGELGGKVRDAYNYYYGNLPAQYTRGSSQYVDRTVWESTNGVLQDVMNVFTSGEDAVKFAPESIQDGYSAEAATSYCNKTLLRDNDGYRVIHDTVKESLLSSAGFSKVYWEDCIEEVEEEFVNVSMDELESLQANRELIVCSIDEGEEKGTYSGDLIKYIDKSGVRIEFVPFENMLIDPTATSIQDATFVACRTRKSLGELLQMGFDPEIVKLGIFLGEDTNPYLDDLADIRQNGINPDAGEANSDWSTVDDELAVKVYLYENYIRTSIINSKRGVDKNKVRLLQVFTLGDKILEVNEVSEVPFEICTPLPIPASVYGESIYDITKDLQDLRTSIYRGYIDNIMSANFGRYTAIKGQYDRRSLLDNRPGGVVEINSAGAINLLPHNQLPMGMENLLERTKQTTEERTGVTRMGMGLSPEVFKNDNAFATVNMMMTAAQNRMRMIARNIAKGYMTQVMLHIYRLARENELRSVSIEIQGQATQVVPAQWAERNRMITSVAIGANENRERAQNLLNLLNVGSSNQMVAGTTFSPKNANYLMQELVKSMGIIDVMNYVTPIAQIPPPQPNPAQELEMMKLQADIEETKANAADKQASAQLEMMKLELEKMRFQSEQQKSVAEMEQQAAKFQFEQEKAADDMDVKQAESESRQDELSDKMTLQRQELSIKERELVIKERELGIKEFEAQLKKEELQVRKQELILETSLEQSQNRPVGLGD